MNSPKWGWCQNSAAGGGGGIEDSNPVKDA